MVDGLESRGLHNARLGDMHRRHDEMMAAAVGDLGDDPDGDVEGYDGGFGIPVIDADNIKAGTFAKDAIPEPAESEMETDRQAALAEAGHPDCMICDLYAVIDRHIGPTIGEADAIADYTADLVTVLPPRGHGLHKLAIWERNYVSRLEHE